MELDKREYRNRTLKVYLTEHITVLDKGNYSIGDTLIPVSIVEHVGNANGLPVLHLKSELDITVHPEIHVDVPVKGECVLFHIHRPDYKSIFIPARLIEKIDIQITQHTVLTPQHSPAESRA